MRTHVTSLIHHVERKSGAASIFASLQWQKWNKILHSNTDTDTHTDTHEAHVNQQSSPGSRAQRKPKNHIENVRDHIILLEFNVRWSLPRMWKCTSEPDFNFSCVRTLCNSKDLWIHSRPFAWLQKQRSDSVRGCRKSLFQCDIGSVWSVSYGENRPLITD